MQVSLIPHRSVGFPAVPRILVSISRSTLTDLYKSQKGARCKTSTSEVSRIGPARALTNIFLNCNIDRDKEYAYNKSKVWNLELECCRFESWIYKVFFRKGSTFNSAHSIYKTVGIRATAYEQQPFAPHSNRNNNMIS